MATTLPDSPGPAALDETEPRLDAVVGTVLLVESRVVGVGLLAELGVVRAVVDAEVLDPAVLDPALDSAALDPAVRDSAAALRWATGVSGILVRLPIGLPVVDGSRPGTVTCPAVRVGTGVGVGGALPAGVSEDADCDPARPHAAISSTVIPCPAISIAVRLLR